MVPSVLARWLGGVAVVAVILLLAMGTNFRAAIEALKLLGVSEHRPVQALLTLPHGAAVLVTGGAGFVGFHLCQRLHRDGVRVVALDNFDPYYSTALAGVAGDARQRASR